MPSTGQMAMMWQMRVSGPMPMTDLQCHSLRQTLDALALRVMFVEMEAMLSLQILEAIGITEETIVINIHQWQTFSSAKGLFMIDTTRYP